MSVAVLMQLYCTEWGRSRNLRRARDGADKAEHTRRRIVAAASELFAERGFAATTIDDIAQHADVAVETIYARFRSKQNLLNAILEPAILGNDDAPDLLDQPPIIAVRAERDQRTQLTMLAAFSRSILERVATVQRILHLAAPNDAAAAELERRDQQRRATVQRTYVDLLLANGPLRAGMNADVAAITYSALANPNTYAFFTVERGWTPDQYQQWLTDSLTRLLLPDQ